MEIWVRTSEDLRHELLGVATSEACLPHETMVTTTAHHRGRIRDAGRSAKHPPRLSQLRPMFPSNLQKNHKRLSSKDHKHLSHKNNNRSHPRLLQLTLAPSGVQHCPKQPHRRNNHGVLKRRRPGRATAQRRQTWSLRVLSHLHQREGTVGVAPHESKYVVRSHTRPTHLCETRKMMTRYDPLRRCYSGPAKKNGKNNCDDKRLQKKQ